MEPDKKAFKLVLHTPIGRTHKPTTLFNGEHNGRWRADLDKGVSATVHKEDGGQWLLTLRRGMEACTFYPVTETRKPWELTFWLPGAWFGPSCCEVFVTAA